MSRFKTRAKDLQVGDEFIYLGQKYVVAYITKEKIAYGRWYPYKMNNTYYSCFGRLSMLFVYLINKREIKKTAPKCKSLKVKKLSPKPIKPKKIRIPEIVDVWPEKSPWKKRRRFLGDRCKMLI